MLPGSFLFSPVLLDCFFTSFFFFAFFVKEKGPTPEGRKRGVVRAKERVSAEREMNASATAL